MQADLDTNHPGLGIEILGVNEMGLESGNAENCAGRTIPWLQETIDHPCWTPWAATWRDVIILDRENQRAGLFNLTPHDLGSEANYDTLKAMILGVANR